MTTNDCIISQSQQSFIRLRTTRALPESRILIPPFHGDPQPHPLTTMSTRMPHFLYVLGQRVFARYQGAWHPANVTAFRKVPATEGSAAPPTLLYQIFIHEGPHSPLHLTLGEDDLREYNLENMRVELAVEKEIAEMKAKKAAEAKELATEEDLEVAAVPSDRPYAYTLKQHVLAIGEPDLVYNANIIGRHCVGEQHFYRVHYQGWSPGWDRWLPEEVVWPFNEATIAQSSEIAAAKEVQIKSWLADYRRRCKVAKDTVRGAAFRYRPNQQVYLYYAQQLHRGRVLATNLVVEEESGSGHRRPIYLVRGEEWSLASTEWVEEDRLLPRTAQNARLLDRLRDDPERAWWPVDTDLPEELQ